MQTRWIRLVLVALVVLTGCASMEPEEQTRVGTSRHRLVGVPENGYPNYHERAMLTAINRARADPNVVGETMDTCGNTRTIRPPLMRSQSGSRCSRFHCANCILNDGGLSHSSYCDVASNIGSTFESSCDGSAGCACSGNQHFSCTTLGGSGTSPSARCGHFGFSYGGEVGAAGYGTGWDAVWGWMSECPPNTGHRDILTNAYSQIGVGYYTGNTACWSRLYFGDLSNAAVTTYTLPAGIHRPETGSNPDFYVNYYDPNGAPNSIHVVVDGVCHAMSLEIGSATNGTYHTTVNVGSGCHQYWFLAWDGSNVRKAYPEIGAWGVGSCTGYDQNATVADCENCTNGDTQPCGVGECAGTQTCNSGTWSACNGQAPAPNESCDGLDNDCDGTVPANEVDNDGDNYRICDGDCADGNDQVNPGATEVCNGVDDDCAGGVPADEVDADDDGYLLCELDCDDDNDQVNPGATEQCDGIDNNCDEAIDEGCPCDEGETRPCGEDVGACTAGTQTCTGGTWGGCEGGVLPSPEQCNGLDDDCDGVLPEGEADADSDGMMPCDGDCDDENPQTYAGATELCNEVDDDCDNEVDEQCTTDPTDPTGPGPDGEPIGLTGECGCRHAGAPTRWPTALLLLGVPLLLRRRRR